MATYFLQAIPRAVRADATSLLVFYGPPDRTVSWSLSGTGSLTPITTYTDEGGRAYAKYTPGSVNDAPVITAEYGAA